MRKAHTQEVLHQRGNAQICLGGIEAEWRYLAKPGDTRAGFLEGKVPSLTLRVESVRLRGNEEDDKLGTAWVPARSAKHSRVGCCVLNISQGTGQRQPPSEYFPALESLEMLYLISYATFFTHYKGPKLLKKKTNKRLFKKSLLVEFVPVLFLFYVLGFWLQGMRNLSSPTRDQTHTSCIGK